MKDKVLDKLSTLLIAAFGLVAALAWNDAIKALFKERLHRSMGNSKVIDDNEFRLWIQDASISFFQTNPQR